MVIGFDRAAANGDVANKVGTYGLALAAAAAGMPFVVAGPYASIDLSLAHGDAIAIEERDADEVRRGDGRADGAPRTPRAATPPSTSRRPRWSPRWSPSAAWPSPSNAATLAALAA